MASRPAQLAIYLFWRVQELKVRKKRLVTYRQGQDLPSRGEPTTCELCRRNVDRFTVHHLIPKSRGGRLGSTARLCPTCHRQMHSMFSETTLARVLHSIELLQANAQVRGYLKWIRKQQDGAIFRVRRANQRR